MAGFLDILPILLLIAFVSIFGWVGYQMYLYSQVLSDRAKNKLEKHNVSYSKNGGMKVGYKGMSNEEYSDKTQGVIVDAWNKSQWPDYKSRLWNKEAQKQAKASSNTVYVLSSAKSSGSKR